MGRNLAQRRRVGALRAYSNGHSRGVVAPLAGQVRGAFAWEAEDAGETAVDFALQPGILPQHLSSAAGEGRAFPLTPTRRQGGAAPLHPPPACFACPWPWCPGPGGRRAWARCRPRGTRCAPLSPWPSSWRPCAPCSPDRVAGPGGGPCRRPARTRGLPASPRTRATCCMPTAVRSCPPPPARPQPRPRRRAQGGRGEGTGQVPRGRAWTRRTAPPIPLARRRPGQAEWCTRAVPASLGPLGGGWGLS